MKGIIISFTILVLSFGSLHAEKLDISPPDLTREVNDRSSRVYEFRKII